MNAPLTEEWYKKGMFAAWYTPSSATEHGLLACCNGLDVHVLLMATLTPLEVHTASSATCKT